MECRGSPNRLRRWHAALPFDLRHGRSHRYAAEVRAGNAEARVLELAAKVRMMLSRSGAEVNEDNSPIVTAVVPGYDSEMLEAEFFQSLRDLHACSMTVSRCQSLPAGKPKPRR
jgi:hypothetical protein